MFLNFNATSGNFDFLQKSTDTDLTKMYYYFKIFEENILLPNYHYTNLKSIICYDFEGKFDMKIFY